RQVCNFFATPAEIDHAVQSGFVVSKLTFVDDEAGFVFTLENLRDDLIEGDDFHFNAGREQFERQVGGGEFAGHRDFPAFDFVLREGPGGNEHGTIAVPHAAAARHQRVVFLNVGKSV